MSLPLDEESISFASGYPQVRPGGRLFQKGSWPLSLSASSFLLLRMRAHTGTSPIARFFGALQNQQLVLPVAS